MSDEPRDETPVNPPVPPAEDVGSTDGSAPWERPRRWSGERLDATRVDDLLARLGSDDSGTPRRRRRTERAPIEHAAPLVPTADTPDDRQEPVAAPSAPAASDPAVEPSALPPVADAPAAAPEAATLDDALPATEVADDVPGESAAPDALIGSEATATTDDAVASEVATDAGTTEPDAPEADSPIADASPVVAESDPADDEAATHAPPVAIDDTQAIPTYVFDDTTQLLPRVINLPDDVESGEDVRARLRASLVAGEGAEEVADDEAPAVAADLSDEPHHRVRAGVMWAGRALAAALSVTLLIYLGTYDSVLDTKDLGTQVNAGLGDNEVVQQQTVMSTPPSTVGEPAPVPVPVEVKTYQQENFLLFGSDTRSGDNGDPSNDDGTLGGVANSDTMMVAHLSADRTRVSIVSLPRDLWIDAPDNCKSWDETNQSYGDPYPTSPGERWHLNSSYSVGGAECLVNAVEGVTGLEITRFLGIDFTGFKAMVDALGGVEINACIPIVDSVLGTVIPNAGSQKIDGTTALNLARARDVEGDTQSDLARITRQQKLLASILREARSTDVLLNLSKLRNFIKSFFSNTIRDHVEAKDMLALAESMGDMDPARVTFYTLPTFDAGDGRSLDLDETNAQILFEALRADQPVPGAIVVPAETSTAVAPSTAGSATTGVTSTGSPSSGSATSNTSKTSTSKTSTTATSTSAAPLTLSMAPGDVAIRLVNAADRAGLSTSTAEALNNLGFNITEDNLLRLPADQTVSGITVKYAPAQLAEALTLASAVPGAVLEEDPDHSARLDLILGTDFDGTVQAVEVGDKVPTDLAAQAGTGAASTSTSATASDSAAPPAAAPAGGGEQAAVASTTGTAPLVTETPEVEQVNAGDSSCM